MYRDGDHELEMLRRENEQLRREVEKQQLRRENTALRRQLGERFKRVRSPWPPPSEQEERLWG